MYAMKQEVSEEAMDLTQVLAPLTVPCSRDVSLAKKEDVTTESNNDDVPYMLRTYVGLWAGALSGITVGALVFAPYRVSTTNTSNSVCAHVAQPHYALAEVTGLQASAGTASVAFLFATPGVDDEAVSLYDLLPCPPSFLHAIEAQQRHTSSAKLMNHNSSTSSSSAAAATCSLLERLVGVRPQDGPVSAATAYTILRNRDAVRRELCGPMSTHAVNTAERCTEDGARGVKCEDDEEEQHMSRKRARTVRDTRSSRVGQADCDNTLGLRSVLCLSESDTEPETAQQKQRQRVQPSPNEKDGSCSSEASSDEEDKEVTADQVYDFVAERNVHCFFLDVFRRIDRTVWRVHRQRFSVMVVLCVFDTYNVLHRFELFAALRGHRVRLLDGETHHYDSSSEEEEEDEEDECDAMWPAHGLRNAASEGRARMSHDLCQGRRPRLTTTQTAFGMTCKVWLCMLREDALRADGLRGLLQTAPPIDAVVHVYEDYESGNSNNEQESNMHCHDKRDTAAQTLNSLLPHLHPVTLRVYVRHLPPWVNGPWPHQAHTSVTRQARLTSQGTQQQQSSAAAATVPRVRVSGGVFANHKVLVPASREQLLLMRSVLAQSDPQDTLHSTQPTQVLNAVLLERIALGNFTDTAVDNLFETSRDTVAVLPAQEKGRARYFSAVKEIETIFRGNAMRLGDVFPIFAAVLAILRDVFGSAQDFIRPAHALHNDITISPDEATRPILPRVALIFAQGNPTHQPQLTTTQFHCALRHYLAPWQVYNDVETSTVPGGSQHECTSVLEWHRRGGVYVLHSDDTRTALALLHTEADIVLACGKSAAAWVAAHSESATQHTSHRRSQPTYFAILSELELVADVTRHLWMPIELNRTATMPHHHNTRMERNRAVEGQADEEHLWRQLLSALPPTETSEVDQRYEHVPKVLQQSVILWHHLTKHDTTGRGAACKWQHMKQLVRNIAIHAATYPAPVKINDLQLYSDT